MPDMMGSLAFAGTLPVDEVRATRGTDGTTVGENLDRIGQTGGMAPGALEISHFLELHIEQGPLLERDSIDIGAVDSVQGISWTEYTLRGSTNHAGTTPMELRQDAGWVAFAAAAHARELAREIGNAHRVTVGSMRVEPGLVNVIPELAVFTVDQRNTDADLLARGVGLMDDKVRELAEAEGVSVEHRRLADVAPRRFDPGLVDLVQATATRLGLSSRRMASGAGHDAQILSDIAPTAMIFIPSAGGVSHSVHEHSAPDDVAAGAAVLAGVLAELVSG
jgi:N-carbamoyl-L-amino-acid hydrolase